MDGIKVGHFTNAEAGTGVSVFLFEKSAVGAYWVCGAAPASHELAALDPDNSVPHIHGLVLAGGSAYGLYAAKGVMTYLTERGIGHPVPHGVVPIVPAAAIYDLSYRQAIPPTAENAYQACLSAKENNPESGRIGGGTGATIGKIIPGARHMSGGLGYAELHLPGGVQVMAYAVVNTIGDIRNAAGEIIAGAKLENGSFADCEKYLLSGKAEIDLFKQANTTLVTFITNARFSKDGMKRVGKMAAAGMSRAIFPSFTQFDGDTLFCISAGDKLVSELSLGTLAAEAVRLAIMDAVKNSEVI
jgi:L-aminopeptidase/D-esterase-like protein